MERIWTDHKLTLVALALLLLALATSVVKIDEAEQAVVIRTGEPVRVINRFRPNVDYGRTGAGLVLRIPFFERVERIDRRVLTLDMEEQQVLSTDQLRLNVDAYARYRIIDPVKMVRTAGTIDTVNAQLSAILSSVVRQELGRRSFASLLAAERGATMQNIRRLLDTQAREYGAQVIDVRIKRADLPDGTPLQSAFDRMRTARQQEAATIRAQGARDAQIIRAEADAEAARIYAAAFNKNPEFYNFYRAMQSYEATFGDEGSSSQIILSPDNEYLRQFRNPGR